MPWDKSLLCETKDDIGDDERKDDEHVNEHDVKIWYQIMINILSVDDIYRGCVRNSHLKIEADLGICTNSL